MEPMQSTSFASIMQMGQIMSNGMVRSQSLTAAKLGQTGVCLQFVRSQSSIIFFLRGECRTAGNKHTECTA